MSSIKLGNLTFKTIKSVTRPVLKIEKKPVFFKVESVIRQAPATEAGREQKGKDGTVLPPPELMDVIDLETGFEAVVVVNKVLGLELRKTYPKDGYIGKMFSVTKYAPANGKRYATFQISEIEMEKDTAKK